MSDADLRIPRMNSWECQMSAFKTNRPEWGSLDILKDCGSLDPGSNPGSGASLSFRVRAQVLSSKRSPRLLAAGYERPPLPAR